MEMARSVGHSQISSISSLIADSSSSRVFAGFFKLNLSARNGTTAFGYPRERMSLNSGREPLAIRYRRRTQTAGDGPWSQRLGRDNVPSACLTAAAPVYCILPSVMFAGVGMDEEFYRQQALRVRDLAGKADPFTRRRLLDLADRYDAKGGAPSLASRAIERPLPLPRANSSAVHRPSGEA
jgi:hypothetical protein